MEKQEVEFHIILAKQVQSLEYGQMTVNVQVKDGLPILDTLNIVKSKRKRYKTDKLTNKEK